MMLLGRSTTNVDLVGRKVLLVKDHDLLGVRHQFELSGPFLSLLLHSDDFLLPAPQHLIPVLFEALGISLFKATIHLFLKELVLGAEKALIEF